MSDKLWRVLKGDLAIVGIALGLWVLAYVLYASAGPDPSHLNAEVERVASELDVLYRTQKPPHAFLFRTLRTEEWHTYRETLVLHICLALFISGILLLGVDIHTRRQMRREAAADRAAVAKDVWKAVSGRLIPDAISQEIDRVLKMDVCKHQVRYVITLTKTPYTDIPPGYIVVRREILYKLKNLTGQRRDHVVRSVLVSHVDDRKVHDHQGREFTLPRQVALRVNRTDVPVGNDREIETIVQLSGGTDPQGEVYIAGEELLAETDRNSYITLTLVEGLEVTVRNELPHQIAVKKVQFSHSSPHSLELGTDGVYRFPGGMVPGQSFLVTWERIQEGTYTG